MLVKGEVQAAQAQVWPVAKGRCRATWHAACASASWAACQVAVAAAHPPAAALGSQACLCSAVPRSMPCAEWMIPLIAGWSSAGSGDQSGVTPGQAAASAGGEGNSVEEHACAGSQDGEAAAADEEDDGDKDSKKQNNNHEEELEEEEEEEEDEDDDEESPQGGRRRRGRGVSERWRHRPVPPPLQLQARSGALPLCAQRTGTTCVCTCAAWLQPVRCRGQTSWPGQGCPMAQLGSQHLLFCFVRTHACSRRALMQALATL